LVGLCSALQKAIKGSSFGSDEDIKKAVVQWIQQQRKVFFEEGTHRLVRRWDIYVSVFGDNFLTASALSPGTIPGLVSFEQS
jgi:hypothetical protein